MMDRDSIGRLSSGLWKYQVLRELGVRKRKAFQGYGGPYICDYGIKQQCRHVVSRLVVSTSGSNEVSLWILTDVSAQTAGISWNRAFDKLNRSTSICLVEVERLSRLLEPVAGALGLRFFKYRLAQTLDATKGGCISREGGFVIVV